MFDANDVQSLSVYIDGADEIDGNGNMIKGGGAALTREKIVAALAQRFVCIADESKRVEVLGKFPLPVEVIPMATQHIARRFEALGGVAKVRLKDGKPLVTDNGQHILDVTGLSIQNPLEFESQVNQWPGVVTVGVFAHQKAAVCLLGTAQGVQTWVYRSEPINSQLQKRGARRHPFLFTTCVLSELDSRRVVRVGGIRRGCGPRGASQSTHSFGRNRSRIIRCRSRR